MNKIITIGCLAMIILAIAGFVFFAGSESASAVSDEGQVVSTQASFCGPAGCDNDNTCTPCTLGCRCP